MMIYSLRYLRSQVDALQRRLKPVLTILRLRNLAMEFCDEFDEADSQEGAARRRKQSDISGKFMPRVGRAGFRLYTFMDLRNYLGLCVREEEPPDPREIVFTLIPWARKGPHLRPDLWERASA